MIGELDVAGIFFSPLLLCLILGFAGHLLLAGLLESVGAYRFVWQRSLFDISLFVIVTGVAFLLFRYFTTA